MATITRDKVLNEDGGLKLFQLLVPELQMEFGSNRENVDSPISKGKKCFSVFDWGGKYWFKDHYSGKKGDIFELVALLNKLNSRTDFPKILQIIQKLLDNNFAKIPTSELTVYQGYNAQLILISESVSKPYVENNFYKQMPYLQLPISYKIQLVNEYKTFAEDGGDKDYYSFDYSKPQDALYAIVIREAEFYILFNPKTSATYFFGIPPEYFLFGMDTLFQTAYLGNIYLRDTIVITNKVEGVLWCEDKGIPCVALLNGDKTLSDYFEQVILPKFNHKFLILHLLNGGADLMRVLTDQFGFTNIITGESYLHKFFKSGDEAIEKIMDRMEYSEGFEYEGKKNNLSKVTDEDSIL